MTYTKIRKVDSDGQSLGPIREATELIKKGGMVVFPTTGLYGLGVDARNTAAIERVFGAKRRLLNRPLSILVKHRNALDDIVQDILPAAEVIMDRFWPGGVTAVFCAHSSLSEKLTAGSGKIGLRIPSHPVAAALANLLDAPFTATSANVSGQSGCSDIADLSPLIKQEADLLLDAGPLRGGVGTTVVDVSVDPPILLREGAVPFASLLRAIDNHDRI